MLLSGNKQQEKKHQHAGTFNDCITSLPKAPKFAEINPQQRNVAQQKQVTVHKSRSGRHTCCVQDKNVGPCDLKLKSSTQIETPT